jgi:hypothetical protein
MSLSYHNPEDERLRLREYGRNLQKMVDYVRTVEDQERRRLLEEEIIRIMATVTPETQEKQEQRKKLWEHLVRMSEFELADDAPFEIERPALDTPPEPMQYYPHNAKYKQYGSNVELMIQQARNMEEGEKKDAYIKLIAMIMKHFLQNRNANIPSDEVVCEQLAKLSEGEIQLKPEETEQLPDLLSPGKARSDSRNSASGGGGKRKKKKSGGGGKGGGGGNRGSGNAGGNAGGNKGGGGKNPRRKSNKRGEGGGKGGGGGNN